MVLGRRWTASARSFDYIFDDGRPAYEGTSKPALEIHAVEPGRTVSMAGVEVLPLAFRHGHLRVFGYRFGTLAYLTDVKAIPDAEREQLRGWRCWCSTRSGGGRTRPI